MEKHMSAQAEHTGNPNQLTPDNYRKGFLVSDHLMAGLSPRPEGGFLAYVIRVETGESLGAREVASEAEGLALLNAIPEPWRFEATGGCGEGNCGTGEGPHCESGACGRPCEESGSCAF